MAERSGRCACGAVRWQTRGPVLRAGHCHRDSCRRATASLVQSFFGVLRDSVRWQGALAAHLSSQGRVQRQFCPGCSTRITCQSQARTTGTPLYAATPDDPAQVRPQAHFQYSERRPWLQIADTLPKYAGSACDGPAEPTQGDPA